MIKINFDQLTNPSFERWKIKFRTPIDFIDWHLSLIVNIAGIRSHIEFDPDLSIRAFTVRFHHVIVVDLVVVGVLLVLTFADLAVSPVKRDLPEVFKVIFSHIHLDSDFLISALTVRFHHEVVVLLVEV